MTHPRRPCAFAPVALVLALVGGSASAAPPAIVSAQAERAAWPTQEVARQARPSLAPYVPTPQEVAERMLELAEVSSTDVVYDLGSGDGRLVITAAKKYGARGVGIDIDPVRVAEARANAKAAGVEHLVRFEQGDALEADVSDATVVTLYLLSSSNLRLRPLLTRQLRPGARIVSHAFGMGDWAPVRTEAYKDADGATRTLYVWKTDGRVR